MAQHFSSLDGAYFQDTWLTIGSFDGVHIGHQHLIKELNEKAHHSRAKSVVLTFHPHPSVILKGRKDAFYLTTAEEKAQLIDELGADVVVVHPFTHAISQSSASEFVSYLYDHLRFQQLWVGADFALGKGREGNVNYLKNLGDQLKYSVHVIDPITQNNKIVSSSQIRNLLSEGKVEEANILLGRNYRVTGKVIHGDGRGKSIGIPTANLDTGNEKLIPSAGVYACTAYIFDHNFPAAVNIGTRPTFESTDTQLHVEAHILDFSSQIYDQEISLDFISRLRGEQRFSSVDDLITQINLDISKTREIISETLRK